MKAFDELLATDLLTLGMQADDVRRARRGTVVTYLRVHTFTAGDLAGSAQLPEAAAEVRLYELPATLDDAITQVRAMKSIAGSRRVAAYSMAELQRRSANWGPVEWVLSQLIAAGLDDLAEVPVDELPNPSEAMRVLAEAGVRPARLTVARPLGDRKAALLDIVRSVLQAFPSPIRFSPLPRVAPADKPTTGYEDVRMVALARLALDEIADGAVSVEVDWTLYGPKLAQVALTFGADHLDAVPATSNDSLGPRRATVQDVERNIRTAGFEPQEFRPGP